MENNFVLNIDWLQVSCLNFSGKFFHSGWRKKDYTTRLFADVWEFYVQDKIIFSAVTTPRSTIIDKSICIIKCENSTLYESDGIKTLIDIIEYEQLKFNNITRLDICLDFNIFENGLTPGQLIDGFLNNTYLKNGRGTYKLIGEQLSNHVYSYLRFGSNSSAVSAYLYDKTKEMKEVKFKSHIYESWVKNGIDNSQEVWRLEFSMKEFNNILINKESGEYVLIQLTSLLDSAFRWELFWILYNKYFDFRINNHLANKSRMNKLKLFNIDSSKYIYYIDNEYLNHDRSDKILIKKLESVNCELRAIKIDIADDVKDLQRYLIEKKHLEKWATEKGFYKDYNENLESQFYKENEKEQIKNLYK